MLKIAQLPMIVDWEQIMKITQLAKIVAILTVTQLRNIVDCSDIEGLSVTEDC